MKKKTPPDTETQQHDESYKRFFSHAVLVRQLIEAFVPGEWLKDLDFDSLERVPGSFVSADLRERHNDVVWRLRSRKEKDWIYIYLLIEFQSQTDRFMAVRLLVYVALLYEFLCRQEAYRRSGAKLPAVLPLVVYNGSKRWREPLKLSQLLVSPPQGFEAYQPQLSYLLIDEGSFSPEDLRASENLVATLFRLENLRRLSEVGRGISELNEQLDELSQPEVEAAFDVWLERSVRLRFPGLNVGEIRGRERRAMLSETIQKWIDERHREGLQEGLQEGEERGRHEGLEAMQDLLLEQLSQRFAPLPDQVASKVRAIRSMAELAELGRRVLAIESLDDLWR